MGGSKTGVGDGGGGGKSPLHKVGVGGGKSYSHG